MNSHSEDRTTAVWKDGGAVVTRYIQQGTFDAAVTEFTAGEKVIAELEDFIREIGLPTTLTELKANMRPGSVDPTDETILRKVADTCVITPGCARQMSRDEIFEILKECI